MTYLTTKEVLCYLQYTVLRHRQNRSTKNIRVSHMRLYRNGPRIRLVDKLHQQSDCPVPCLITPECVLNSYCTNRVGPNRKSFPLFFEHVYYITPIPQHCWDTWVKDQSTTQCDANITGHISQKTFTRLWEIVSNAPEICHHRGDNSIYNCSPQATIVICLDGHPGPPSKKLSGNWFVMVITECYSKLTIAGPPSKTTALHIVSLILDNLVILYGIHKHVLKDNGTQFISKFLELLCAFLVLNT